MKRIILFSVCAFLGSMLALALGITWGRLPERVNAAYGTSLLEQSSVHPTLLHESVGPNFSGTGYTGSKQLANGLLQQWQPVPVASGTAYADFDGDGTDDIAFFRPSSGLWGVLKSSADFDYGDAMWFSWGGSEDRPVIGYFDNDVKADPTVWHPPEGGQSATHRMLLSTKGYDYGQSQFKDSGWPTLGDTPVAGDFNGDGMTDVAIWRESTGTWIIAESPTWTSYIFAQWGQGGDIP